MPGVAFLLRPILEKLTAYGHRSGYSASLVLE